jgi:hypothetical protein
MAVPSWRRNSPVGAFNAPALLQSCENQGQHAISVKQHDYVGGVLTDGAVIRIEGAPSRVMSRRLAMDSGGATYASYHIGQAWRERRRPQAVNKKYPG